MSKRSSSALSSPSRSPSPKKLALGYLPSIALSSEPEAVYEQGSLSRSLLEGLQDLPISSNPQPDSSEMAEEQQVVLYSPTGWDVVMTDAPSAPAHVIPPRQAPAWLGEVNRLLVNSHEALLTFRSQLRQEQGSTRTS